MNKYNQKNNAITKDKNITTKKEGFHKNEIPLKYFNNKKIYSYFTGILSIRFW